jgi:hypothetical protein
MAINHPKRFMRNRVFLKFVPANDSLARLQTLMTGFDIAVRAPDAEKHGWIKLLRADTVVKIWVDYRYVAKKFECFGIFFDYNETSSPEIIETVAGPCEMHLLFRYEWERAAKEGEVSSWLEQTLIERGKKGEIPADSNAIGVSLVGVFLFGAQMTEDLLIFIDDAELTKLLITRDAEKIRAIASSCEILSATTIDIDGALEI